MGRSAQYCLAAAVLAMAGCGADDDTTESSAAECDGPLQVTVNEPGDAPREVIELAPKVGDTTKVESRMQMNTTLQADGQDVPTQPIPSITIGLLATVDDVGADEITTSFTFNRAELDGGGQAQQRMADSLVGVSGDITTTRHGAYVDESINSSGIDQRMAPMFEQLEQQMADMTVPFPTEPVGVGAEWEVTTSIDAGGITSCYHYTYRLAQFDGEAYELDIDGVQEITPTTLEEDEASIEVISGSGSFTGSNKGNTNFPLAVNGNIHGQTEVEMATDQDDATYLEHTEVNVSISPQTDS